MRNFVAVAYFTRSLYLFPEFLDGGGVAAQVDLGGHEDEGNAIVAMQDIGLPLLEHVL
jgi:hypothetical protein